jgi:phosphate transport system substrate-binding protein
VKSIFVDETLTPIIEDQVDVFENEYEAKIKLISNQIQKAVNSLFKEKGAL